MYTTKDQSNSNENTETKKAQHPEGHSDLLFPLLASFRKESKLFVYDKRTKKLNDLIYLKPSSENPSEEKIFEKIKKKELKVKPIFIPATEKKIEQKSQKNN